MKITLEDIDINKVQKLVVGLDEHSSCLQGLNDRLHELRGERSERARQLSDLTNTTGKETTSEHQIATAEKHLEMATKKLNDMLKKRNQQNVKYDNLRVLVENVAMDLVRHKACPDFLTIRAS